jgi:biuret amidohydrolase
MKTAYGLGIPQTLEEVCDPHRVALLIYDMQAGILSQVLICITSPSRIAIFRNVAPLQLDQEFFRSHRHPHAPHELGEPRIAADYVPHRVVFIKNSDRSRC